MKNAKAAKAMKAAWTNARKAAVKFGGKASEYFAVALRQAWAWVKSAADEFHAIGTVVRETEKAVMVKAEVENPCGFYTQNVWFPKSQLKDGRAPAWLVRAKEAELVEKFRTVYAIEWL